MNRKKKILGLMLIMVMLLQGLPVFAVSNNAEKTEEISQTFKNFMKPFYEGDRNGYESISKNGSVITEKFYQETISFYTEGNWESIHEKFDQELSGMSRTEISYDALPNVYSLDIAKNQSKTFMHLVKGKDENGNGNYARDVVYTLRGTIYYNPNTGKVSSTVGPYVESITIEPGNQYNHYQQTRSTASVAANGQYATFFSTIHIWYGISTDLSDIEVDFGNVTDSFTIYPG